MVKINILRAFVNQDGEFGNPTGIVIDERQKLNSIDRQKIASKLRYTDTVFINNLEPVNISFFNPQQETKFAGDALISTSYFINDVLGKEVWSLNCKGGKVKTWKEKELTWIESDLKGSPSWNHLQLDDPVTVEKITMKEALKFEHSMVWAWIDKEKGVIRSRTFLPDWGTLEDQGNGSGSMQLARVLKRRIEIHQGKGSVIYASPAGKNSARVGGRVGVDRLSF
ncbi:PhzF family phenazine biosynthesis protein [Patescibacteria group bacterium]|nr:PhzF family phenazine biosynthesis protein [Patescibacteria group bacterium]